MNRYLISAVAGVLALTLTTPLAFGNGHGGKAHASHTTAGQNHHKANTHPGHHKPASHKPVAHHPKGKPNHHKHLAHNPHHHHRRHHRHGWGGNGGAVAVASAAGIDPVVGVNPIVPGPTTIVPTPAVDNGALATPAGLPWQTVRYVQVNNRTDSPMTVYARMEDDEEPLSWVIAPGASAYLTAPDGEKLAADEVWLWASAGGKNYDTYKTKALVLVPDDYQAANIETFTQTFGAP